MTAPGRKETPVFRLYPRQCIFGPRSESYSRILTGPLDIPRGILSTVFRESSPAGRSRVNAHPGDCVS